MPPRMIQAARLALAYALAGGLTIAVAPFFGAPAVADDPAYYVTAGMFAAVTSAAFAYHRRRRAAAGREAAPPR